MVYFTNHNIDIIAILFPYRYMLFHCAIACPSFEFLHRLSTTTHRHPAVCYFLDDISTYFTLEPGDILATGTPSGVAMGMEEPKWMQPGDVVECYVEGIGTLRNTVE